MILPWLLACTFSPGGAFTHVDDARVSAALDPGPARDLGDGGLLTDRGDRVWLDAATLGVVEARLESLEGTVGGFDPSSPPPGYTLCHGGHCHHEDGRLVAYAEVEAELAGDAAALVPVVVLPVGDDLDLLAPDARDTDVLPSRDLPRVSASLLRVRVDALALTGEVETADGAVPLVVDLPLDASLTDGVDLDVHRDLGATAAFTVSVPVDATLFDGLDLAALADGGAVTLDDSADPAAASVLERLLANRPTLILE